MSDKDKIFVRDKVESDSNKPKQPPLYNKPKPHADLKRNFIIKNSDKKDN